MQSLRTMPSAFAIGSNLNASQHTLPHAESQHESKIAWKSFCFLLLPRLHSTSSSTRGGINSISNSISRTSNSRSGISISISKPLVW